MYCFVFIGFFPSSPCFCYLIAIARIPTKVVTGAWDLLNMLFIFHLVNPPFGSIWEDWEYHTWEYRLFIHSLSLFMFIHVYSVWPP